MVRDRESMFAEVYKLGHLDKTVCTQHVQHTFSCHDEDSSPTSSCDVVRLDHGNIVFWAKKLLETECNFDAVLDNAHNQMYQYKGESASLRFDLVGVTWRSILRLFKVTSKHQRYSGVALFVALPYKVTRVDILQTEDIVVMSLVRFITRCCLSKKMRERIFLTSL